MRFAHPELLWLLALLPLLALWKGGRGGAAPLQYSSAEIIRQVARASRARAGRWLGGLRLLALACLIVALARPQLGRGATEIQASGIDIVLAVDVSGSMEAMDFELDGRPVNRLEVVKSVVTRFIESRPNDRIGLVAFAGRPYLVSPLSLDHDWLIQNLDRLRVGMVEDGTAIGSGLAASVNRLRGQPAKSKIVILLTDGINNAGKIAPQTAAEAARALGIKVYAIGAGGEGTALLPARDSAGNPVRDMFGAPQLLRVRIDVDEKSLRQMADATGGRFHRATDTDSLERVYAEIDRLEKTIVTLKKYQRYEELFAWVLLPGLVLLGTELLLANTRFRRLP